MQRYFVEGGRFYAAPGGQEITPDDETLQSVLVGEVGGDTVAAPPEIVEGKAVSAPNPEPIHPETKSNMQKCTVCGKEMARGMFFHMRTHKKVA
jgi:hypothetical protein